MASCTYKANGEYICFNITEQDKQPNLLPCGCKHNQLLNVIQQPDLITSPSIAPNIIPNKQSNITENMEFEEMMNNYQN
jgi:hypothetical protein